MPFYDQHLHSWHSFDSETDPADNCRAAIDKGLAGLTFTEHFDTHPSEWPDCRYDEAKVVDSIAKLRAEFGDRLFIGKGIEVCYQPMNLPEILKFLEKHTFDVVLLSVHWAGGKSLYPKEGWAGAWRARTREYFKAVLEAARFCKERREKGELPFNVLGHLDLAKRYSARYCGAYDLVGYRDIIEEILKTCVAADMAIEVNTSTMRQGLDEPMPAEWIVQQFLRAGGRRVTIGSDAHKAEDIGANFKDAAKLITSAGLSHFSVYKQRVPYYEALPGKFL